ncbi:hypothetical protein SAY87_023783 [Trapa incisa]|uniref:Uncharacterized protein n=1 Tax=Trapa incisa TaxID=236973 RepID=A0AAN7L7C3_9MYRT|nr:hypothetical protein SAY87_023783 [Trapa incisa]
MTLKIYDAGRMQPGARQTRYGMKNGPSQGHLPTDKNGDEEDASGDETLWRSDSGKAASFI